MTVSDGTGVVGVGQIKKAYRRLALINHPDKGGSNRECQMISQAYETLNDETARDDQPGHLLPI